MKFYSLNGQSPPVDFKEAVIRGQAPDKGLYFPAHIPVLDSSFFYSIVNMSDEEIAFRVIRPYVGESIPEPALRKIIEETLNFKMPLVQVRENIFSLELFHGPTLAFKDVGARFMSRCLGYFSGHNSGTRPIVVLVATSGDTGGAVANGFYAVPGVKVVILYPSGKVSSVQEKQLTALGKNIHAIEVNGNFDDCQRMVKEAFADTRITELSLTSANSINIARWLPQQFYFFFAWKQWPNKRHPPVISVPSGNFGNLCAAILAHASGLPVKHFLAACNVNDVVSEFLVSGNYLPKKTVATISSAMDVGDPSNFARILEIFEHTSELRKTLSAFSITDDETKAVIQRVYKQNGYLLDPHGAVGFLALERYLEPRPAQGGIFVETAHPVKFYDVVEPLIEEKIPVPSSVLESMSQYKVTTKMDPDYAFLKDFLAQLK